MSGSDDYSDEEGETCLLDVSYLKYSPKKPPKLCCNLSEILDTTYSAFKLNHGKLGRNAYSLFVSNRQFFEDLFLPLFWLTHTMIYHPDSKKDIQHLKQTIGTSWGHFCFPFETDRKLNPQIRDIFFDAIPYFYTQAIQHAYIKLSHGNPEITAKHFRMKICSTLVFLFTSINRVESHIDKRLRTFFEKPPPAEEFDREIPKPEEPVKSTFIPKEDLSTLIEVQRRKKPRSTHWDLSGISPFISASTNRRKLPYEHDQEILIQYPPEDETEWTTKLPPLLPPEITTQVKDMSIDKYNPNNETRSLLQRSRRPFLANQIAVLKNQFAKEQKKQEYINSKIHQSNKEMRDALLVHKTADLDAFLKDLRQLQLENKRNETPELVPVEIPDFDDDDEWDQRKINMNHSARVTNVSTLTANRKASEQALEDSASNNSDFEKGGGIRLFDPSFYMTFDFKL